MNSLHSQDLPARCDWQSFPRKSRAVTVKTNGIGTGALGLSGYCSRTMCIDKTSAPYCPFNGMRDDFMAPIHFLTAILCNIFTSPLRSRPRARQCWLWWVKRPIKFSPSRDGRASSWFRSRRFLLIWLCIQGQTTNFRHVLASFMTQKWLLERGGLRVVQTY